MTVRYLARRRKRTVRINVKFGWKHEPAAWAGGRVRRVSHSFRLTTAAGLRPNLNS